MQQAKKILDQRIKKYGLERFLIPEKSLSDMSIDELRDYASALEASRYDKTVYSFFSNELSDYEKQLNQEFFNRLKQRGLLDIYKWLDTFNRDSVWESDIDYRVLVRDSKPSREAAQVLQVLKIKEFLDTYQVPLPQLIALYQDVKATHYFARFEYNSDQLTKGEMYINAFWSTF
ncbi:hypothetical protein PP175_29085 (plasmid) [Aneurinibacillus sp. Ricciae_BoGa-3]|uniref:hypothetical protein n=1 Tax=Aneurinibacillus sp. Ricciae_BoGa-3 TaxID=3022697 RepID=UPI002340595D|nr:hypothetical protein [Aneurinibacillus sp. Ricciae_BoGa-3]WCK57247.1 hypothetical protein PP175_29085 [Aneurinibacillus sp. Ricciae_BoGa-3]